MNFLIVIMPFIGTTLGALMVIFMKNKMNKRIEKCLLGFASGVMVAASFFSLLLPSIEMVEHLSWLPASIGFMLGILFLLLLDSVIPHLHVNSDYPEGKKSKLRKTTMMVLAVTLHNIPEGMAVGVILSGALMSNLVVTITGALSLSIGIAIQNFPEGAIISMPLKSGGMSKLKAFYYGMLSGIVEPIAAVITLILTSTIAKVLPYLLSFAAGAMIYVVVDELVPSSQSGKHSNLAILSFALGFTIMMILDVALD